MARLDALQRPQAGGRTIPVLMIVGTAGVGKTTLAVRLAHRIRDRFPDGQLFVNLRGYDAGPPLAPEVALERFLRALGTPAPAVPASLEERAELYRSLMAGRRILVVLDNAATAGQVRPLLPGGPDCLVLMTSRHRLSGLAVRDGARRVTLETFSQQQSRELFAVATHGHRDGDDPAAIAELARLCAHLPLALRIAAERAATHPLVPLPELNAHLRDESSRWEALSSSDDGEPDAVRTVFAWSYHALPPPAAHLYCLLGLHPGPDFCALAASALANQQPAQVRRMLDLLVGAHMLEQTGSSRYRFHDLLRAYAADQARDEVEPHARLLALTRLVSWYLHAADSACRAVNADPFFSLPPDDDRPFDTPVPHFSFRDSAMRWYHDEQANLSAATQAAARVSLHQITWRIPATLHDIHSAVSPFDDWLAMAGLGLQAAQHAEDQRAQALMHHTLAVAHRTCSRLKESAVHHQAALDLRTRTEDWSAAAQSANGLGLVHAQRRDLAAAHRHLHQALTLHQEHSSRAQQAVTTCNLGHVAALRGDYEQAQDLAHQALAVYQDVGGNMPPRIDALILLARVSRKRGALGRAETYLEDAYAYLREIKHPVLEAALRRETATLRRSQGRHDEALHEYRRSLTLQRAVGNVRGQALTYDGIGQTLRAVGLWHQAIDIHHMAAAILRDPLEPWHLAQVLTHLADAYQGSDQPQEAYHCRAEALTHLVPFEDSEAAHLRRRLRDLIQLAPPARKSQ